MEQYQDSSESLSIKNYEFLPDGTLKCWARIAKVGTYDYGSHKQEITEDTLFERQSLDSIVGRPVTLEHPPTFIMSVADRQKYHIGTALQEAVKETDGDDIYLTVPLIIWDKESIDSIVEKKVNQFSPGYLADKVKDSDRIVQKDRRYNHFSLTQSGRGGDTVRALVDSNVTLQKEEKNTMNVETVTPAAPTPPTVQPEPEPVPVPVPVPVPEPVPTPTPAPAAPPSPQPETQTDSVFGTVKTLVKLHAEYRDSFVNAGIEPDYNWTVEELKRRVVAVKTGKDATALNESQCDAVLSFLDNEQTTKNTDSLTVPRSQVDPTTEAEIKYLQRLESAYKSR